MKFRMFKSLATDLWIFADQIQKKDITLPMPLPVKWVGEIPVITMHNFIIPGLGTFSAHVVIDGKKYAAPGLMEKSAGTSTERFQK